MATKAVMDTIKQHLQAAEIVKKTSVFIHAGKFSWNELKARSFNAPALFITCLGWKDADEYQASLLNSELAVEARFAIGIVTSNRKTPESRNVQARAIAEQVTLMLIEQDWELPNCLVVTNRRSEGLFVPAAEEESCSLWLVTFNQVVGLTRADLQASINDWQRYHAEHLNPENPNQVMADATVDFTQENS